MNKNNDKVIAFKVSQEERRTLEAAAYQQGRTSLSAFIRQASLAAAHKLEEVNRRARERARDLQS